MPTGKIRKYDAEKGFGFIVADDGSSVFLHESALPDNLKTIEVGTRVEYSILNSQKGVKATLVSIISEPQKRLALAKKSPDDMVVLIEDSIRLLEDISKTYRAGKNPDANHARKVASVLKGVANYIQAK